MKIKKILNLYGGIGGNRKLWGDDFEITMVEHDPKIADIYHDFFPKDKIVVADAHEYLLEHFEEFDFIWSSPPCPTHSKFKEWQIKIKSHKPIFPEMKLYEEIIFLKYFFKGKWVVENVKSYYEPLIAPTEVQRHYFWSNFIIRDRNFGTDNIQFAGNKELSERHGFDLSKFCGIDKRNLLRNCVVPELGNHILDLAINPIEIQKTMF